MMNPENSRHSVIIQFYRVPELDELHALEIRLIEAIEAAAAGEYDGHEVALDDFDGRLYMYGPNAETLFKVVKPILDNTGFLKGAVATLTFGRPSENTLELDVTL